MSDPLVTTIVPVMIVTVAITVTIGALLHVAGVVLLMLSHLLQRPNGQGVTLTCQTLYQPCRHGSARGSLNPLLYVHLRVHVHVHIRIRYNGRSPLLHPSAATLNKPHFHLPDSGKSARDAPSSYSNFQAELQAKHRLLVPLAWHGVGRVVRSTGGFSDEASA